MASSVEPDAGDGGAGAPPAENEANHVFGRLTREYARPEIRVLWYAARCIHSGACIRALPAVFNTARRPWVDVSAAGPDALARAVMKCPTGALRFERLDGGPQEPVPELVEITPVKNGPNFVRGAIELRDAATGQTVRETRVALCRCGQSKHMPYCDNTHRAIGFRTPAGSG
jgi:uncharacterized Fe-S cluster protein YjdI